jgi:hypothetical protein
LAIRRIREIFVQHQIHKYWKSRILAISAVGGINVYQTSSISHQATISSSIDSKSSSLTVDRPTFVVLYHWEKLILRLCISNTRQVLVLHFCMWKFILGDKTHWALPPWIKFHILFY